MYSRVPVAQPVEHGKRQGQGSIPMHPDKIFLESLKYKWNTFTF